MNIKEPSTLVIYAEAGTNCKLTDDIGRLHYFRHFENSGFYKLNIPVIGVYSLSGVKVEKILPLQKVKYNAILPAPERINTATGVHIGGENLPIKSPARIFPKTGKIETNHDFKKLPPPVRLFILLHEKAHLLYKTEKYCDQYALKHFLEMGYNHSTAMYCLTRILGNGKEANERKQNLFNEIKNL